MKLWNPNLCDSAQGGVLEYTYPFNVARKSTPDEVFQTRKFIRDLDDSQSLSSLRLS